MRLIKKKKNAHSNQNSILLSLQENVSIWSLGNAHWTQPASRYSDDLCNSLGMELCKEVTSSDWTERCSISENKDNWLINGNLEGISPEWFLFPRNLQLIGHLKAGLFSLSHGPELLMLQTELRSQLETLLLWATLGMPKPLWMLGEKVSVWVMRPGRISVVSLPEFGALILSKISDSGSHLESIILNV